MVQAGREKQIFVLAVRKLSQRWLELNIPTTLQLLLLHALSNTSKRERQAEFRNTTRNPTRDFAITNVSGSHNMPPGEKDKEGIVP